MKWARDRIGEIREGQQRAQEKRREILQRLKNEKEAAERTRETLLQAEVAKQDAIAQALNEKRARFKFINVERAVAAISGLRIWDLERGEKGTDQRFNRPTLELVRSFLSVLRQERSLSVLQWPYGQRDIALVHPLAMLGIMASPPPMQSNGYTWCEAVQDFRTLYFPWRGNATGANLRDLLVMRNEVIKQNMYHLTRSAVGASEASDEMQCLHKTLGNLGTLKKRDVEKPHLAHPSLYEMFPMFAALGGEGAPRPFRSAINELYNRVAYGARLSELTDFRGGLSQPATAPFGLFGICPRSDVKRMLSQTPISGAPGKGRAPDVCIIDAGPPGLSRLGPDWEGSIADFIDQLDALHPATPIMSVTSDIYVHRRVQTMLERRNDISRGTVGSTIVVRSSEDPLEEDPPQGAVSPVQFMFHSTSGDGPKAIRALADAAKELADRSMAGRIRQKIGDLRRAMSLPCGLSAAYQFIEETEGQSAAEDFLQHRSEGEIVNALRRAAEDCESDSERAKIQDAEKAVSDAFKGFETETPIGSLLVELATSLVRKSTRSLLAFASEGDRRLGEFRITGKDDLGAAVRRRLEDGHMRITTCRDLETPLKEIQATHLRNYWKRLIVIAPGAEQLAVILGKKWLPDEIIVIGDREFVARVASTYRPLSNHPDLAGPDKIGMRLAAAAAAARTEAEARAVPAMDLELSAHRPPERDESVIDLAGDDEDEENGEIVELTLESGRLLRARPHTLIIRHEVEAEVNPFNRLLAREVKTGHTIVVPDVAFLAEARKLLPVKVLAQGWIDIYHASVEAALQNLEGDSLAAKARSVRQKMGQHTVRQVSVQAVADWLKVTEHRKAAAEVLRPHAPMRRREFGAFANVLGLSPDLADKIWREGIEPLRIDRRRAGARMAQAFVSVLVDPHGSASNLTPEIKEKIGELRKRAREHLDGVVQTKTNKQAERGLK